MGLWFWLTVSRLTLFTINLFHINYLKRFECLRMKNPLSPAYYFSPFFVEPGGRTRGRYLGRGGGRRRFRFRRTGRREGDESGFETRDLTNKGPSGGPPLSFRSKRMKGVGGAPIWDRLYPHSCLFESSNEGRDLNPWNFYEDGVDELDNNDKTTEEKWSDSN